MSSLRSKSLNSNPTRKVSGISSRTTMQTRKTRRKEKLPPPYPRPNQRSKKLFLLFRKNLLQLRMKQLMRVKMLQLPQVEKTKKVRREANGSRLIEYGRANVIYRRRKLTINE